MRIRVGTGAEGEVVLPPAEAEALGLAGGGGGELLTARGAFTLLLPARADQPGAWFAGSLAAISVPEVIQFLFTSLKTGVLLLAFGEGRGGASAPERLRRKSIYFRDGQIAFASSSDLADRLGQVLRRAGTVSAADLERCSHLVRSGRPLGQVLVDEGVLTAGQLYEGVSHQVKEILLNAFVETNGTFAFLEGPPDERNAVKLPQRTRDLLLEGIRRVEEAEELAQELGGRRGVFAAGGGEPQRPLTPEEDAVLQVCDGRKDLVEVALEAGLGHLLALRAAAGLLRDGLLRRVQPSEEPPPEPEREETPTARISGPFEIYRRIFVRVHEAIAGSQEDATARLNSYFQRLPARNRAVFDGVRFGPDGDIDVKRVFENVSARGEHKGAAARARALEALEDLLSFALFEVKNCLERGEADMVLREVGRMQMGRG